MKDKKKRDEEKRTCKYPRCYYHSPKATEYCCAACSGDHYDCVRLGDCKEGG